MIRRTLINHHLLRTNIERNVKQIVRRTYTAIQGVKGYMGPTEVGSLNVLKMLCLHVGKGFLPILLYHSY